MRLRIFEVGSILKQYLTFEIYMYNSEGELTKHPLQLNVKGSVKSP